MPKRGRPKGTIVRLFNDSGRFEIAAWMALTTLGIGPYPAAYLTVFLITSDRPITTESIDDVILTSNTSHSSTIIGHSDRIRRKAIQALDRADANERAWLEASATRIMALITYIANNDMAAATITLDLLRRAGWEETLDRIGKRIEASIKEISHRLT